MKQILVPFSFFLLLLGAFFVQGEVDCPPVSAQECETNTQSVACQSILKEHEQRYPGCYVHLIEDENKGFFQWLVNFVVNIFSTANSWEQDNHLADLPPTKEKEPDHKGEKDNKSVLPQEIDSEITIDSGTTFQKMEGFGFTLRLFDDPHMFDNWNLVEEKALTTMSPEEKEEIISLLYSDLGLTRTRTAQDQGMEPVNDNNDPYVANISNFNFKGKLNDGYIDYVELAVPKGLNIYFRAIAIPESWMNEENPEELAEHIYVIIKRWKDRGLEMPYFSILNEPGYTYGGLWSGEYIRDVVKILGKRLEEENIGTRLVVSDDWTAQEAYKRVTVILEDPESRKYIGALAYHLYDLQGNEQLADRSLNPYKIKIKELSELYDIPIWMTEYSEIQGIDWKNLMHYLISDYGVSAVDYMNGFFGDWVERRYIFPNAQLIVLNTDHNGENYVGYEIKDVYYEMGHYSKYIRPGSMRIGAESNDNYIKVTGYKDNGEITLVILNTASDRKNVQVTLNEPITLVEGIQTTRSEKWKEISKITVDGKPFNILLPPDSITTLIGKDNYLI